MTLSLDDVRNKRFRMARKSGYEVLEVDEFVDEVEETFGQLVEENQNLKRQVDALKSAPAPTPPAAPVVQQQQPASAAAPAPAPAPNQIVVTTGKEASSAVIRLVEMSTEQSERLVAEANDEAKRIREEANRNAHQVTTDARTRAERVESEARVNAERVQSDALGRSDKLDRDLESRRIEMFGSLEKQRDDLASTVTSLRSFEATYRGNLTSHLRNQIESLENGRAEPADAPEVVRPGRPSDQGDSRSGGADQGASQSAGSPSGTNHGYGYPADRGNTGEADRDDAPTLGGGGSASDTPRLDALLGDQR